MASDLERLAEQKYVLLTTFRKDGRAVPTAVWAARDGDDLVVFTAPDAGKVKRIRRDGSVRVAPCDVRGNPKGDDVAATARILGETDARRALGLIGKKYGLLGRLTILGGKIRRRGGLPGAVAIRLGPVAPATS
jgi:PPOX class probable F420-dependent enzyme